MYALINRLLSRPLDRRLFGLCALALLACVAQSAQAQLQSEVGTISAVVAPPVEQFHTSPGGVNLATGEYRFDQLDASIGDDSGSGGIALRRQMRSDVIGHVSPFGNLAHNWEIMITEQFVDIGQANYARGSGPDMVVGVHFGGLSETFESRVNQSVFEQASRNPRARLTYTGTKGSAGSIYTYQATDGTIAVFRALSANECSSIDRCAYVSYVQYTDGTRLDFTYESGAGASGNGVRLRRVSSSRGYALVIEYSTSAWNLVGKACLINLAIMPAPANNVCPVSAQATTTYAYTGTLPNWRLASATDAANAAWTYAYADVDEGTQMRFFRPGEGEPWLINTYAEITNRQGVIEDRVLWQIFGDGGSLSYFYYDGPEAAIGPPPINIVNYINNIGEVNSVEFGTYLYPGTFSGLANSECCTQLTSTFLDELREGMGVGSTQILHFDWAIKTVETSGGLRDIVVFGDPDGGDLIAFHLQMVERMSARWLQQQTLSENTIVPPCCAFRYQVTPGPSRILDPLGRETLIDYCDPNAMANLPASEHNRCLVSPVIRAVTRPDGVRIEYTWDMATRNLLQTRQKAVPGSGLADIITSATYDCTAIINCGKPSSSTDANGNVTNYTYDATHGGLLTETGPAVDVVLPDGTVRAAVRPQTRNTYVQRQAWVSNGAGGYVQTGQPIWLLATTSMCRSSAATGNPASPCAVAGDEVLTSFDYGPNSGPNNLLLRGQTVTADGVTLRTCWTYDASGRRLSETEPNANLGSCP